MSPGKNVTFADEQTGQTRQAIQACKSATDVIQIDIWNMQTTPTNPNLL